MPTYFGVVKGDVVVPPPEARLPEGSTVAIRVPDEAAILAAKEAMLAAGLITTIRMPGRPLPAHTRGAPLAVAEPPASELVIQERR